PPPVRSDPHRSLPEPTLRTPTRGFGATSACRIIAGRRVQRTAPPPPGAPGRLPEDPVSFGPPSGEAALGVRAHFVGVHVGGLDVLASPFRRVERTGPDLLGAERREHGRQQV